MKTHDELLDERTDWLLSLAGIHPRAAGIAEVRDSFRTKVAEWMREDVEELTNRCRDLDSLAGRTFDSNTQLSSVVRELGVLIRDLEFRANSRYDFNADPDGMTRRVGAALLRVENLGLTT